MSYEEIVNRLHNLKNTIEEGEPAEEIADELGILINDIEDGTDILESIEF
tara:strand:- start:223 stop:372 length:150 start_codon:yes stop_codon:yes gene_type:complete